MLTGTEMVFCPRFLLVLFEIAVSSPPRKGKFENSFQGPKFIELWLVLEEDPETQSAYKVVFDELTKQLGLATPGDEWPVLIGYYGTFINTLESM